MKSEKEVREMLDEIRPYLFGSKHGYSQAYNLGRVEALESVLEFKDVKRENVK